jgi:site-specific DNA-methyltransferase (adenine-specific)
MEPITVARKPLAPGCTVAENVLQHGTGAINVDGCRVGSAVETWPATRSYGGGTEYAFTHTAAGVVNAQPTGNPPPGRWPANLIHDGSDGVVGLFPQTSGGAFKLNSETDRTAISTRAHNTRQPNATGSVCNFGDSGSAARFFYCAKASKRERDAGCEGLTETKAGSLNMRTDAHSERNGMSTQDRRNTHPTVKPLALMRYLVRLVLPPGGVLLDPFAGSGTTGLAAIAEGRKAILIEREERYCEISARRMAQQVLPLGT